MRYTPSLIQRRLKAASFGSDWDFSKNPILPFSTPFYTQADRRAWNDALRGYPPPESANVHTNALLKALSQRLGVPMEWILLTNSCTAALATIYHFVAKDKIVECPVMTWPSSYACAPQYALLDTTEYTELPNRVRTVVDLWGMHNQLDVHQCAKHGPVVVDAAQNVLDPVHIEELRSGKAYAVAYSFGPVKQISANLGGAIISPHITEYWYAFANSGCIERHAIYGCGFNFCMGEPNAALALSQLQQFDQMQTHRHAILRIYEDNVSGYVSARGSGHLAVYTAKTPMRRDAIRVALHAENISTGLHYGMPDHLPLTMFPDSEYTSRTILTLPCHCAMSLADAERIANVVYEVETSRRFD